MSINRSIIIKSIRLALGIGIINIVLSLILSNAYFGRIEINNITGIIGDITFLESGLLFLYGFIGAYSNNPRLRWNNNDENNSTIVRSRSILVVPTKRRMELVDDVNPSKQERPFISILCGAILLAEIIVLAILVV
ncbi:MAG: hypothetical protein ABSA11_15870 [Candidatus Bathyarchaeia archaeon]